MFSFLKKKNEIVEVEPIESIERNFNEVSNISVRDLKQHLVDGYDLEKKLEEEVSSLTRELEMVNADYSNLKEQFGALQVVAEGKTNTASLNSSRLELLKREY